MKRFAIRAILREMNTLALTLFLLHPWAGDIAALRETPSAAQQTDDPAIWVNRKNPAQSLIFGTVKMAAPDGAIQSYGLDGKLLQNVPGVDRPNNIDVEYGLRLGGRRIDIAVVTERNQHRLRAFEIVPGVGLKDLAALPVFVGQTGAAQQPMGIGLYRRPKDGAIFAIVSRKSGPSGTYLWQYELADDGTGKLVAHKRREFGQFSNSKEIEAVVVDDRLGYVYYSDEGAGIRKYHADPAHPDAATELALFATTGWSGDREGLALYEGKGRSGYIIATDQQHPNSVFHVFDREGSPGKPHDHSKELASFRVGADTTDGIEVISRPLGPDFPQGLFVAMNDSRHNFLLVDWRKIAASLPKN
jgi:3-phytase